MPEQRSQLKSSLSSTPRPESHSSGSLTRFSTLDLLECPSSRAIGPVRLPCVVATDGGGLWSLLLLTTIVPVSISQTRKL